jgi:outer membrane lipoprotein-sorting protein
MKKLVIILALLVPASFINAQSLEEIVKKYSAVMKTDQLANVKTIKITAKMSAMGMEMPMTMYMKNPNKIRSVINMNGQEMITVYDGEKGYMINPMTGSTAPVELTGEQLKRAQNNNVFQNDLLKYFKNGQLTLEGDENVNGKPAFKLKANVEGGNPIYMFVDKDTYMLVKSSTKVDQMGQIMDIDTFMSDYTDNQGVVMPKKMSYSSSGAEMGAMTFDNIEVNIPMEDSLFQIKQ